MSFDVALIIDSIPEILTGIGLTFQLLFLSLALGTALAIVLLLLRISGRWYLAAPTMVYIYIFRGTPILVQIFIIYYGLPQLEFVRDSIFWPIFARAFRLCNRRLDAEYRRLRVGNFSRRRSRRGPGPERSGRGIGLGDRPRVMWRRLGLLEGATRISQRPQWSTSTSFAAPPYWCRYSSSTTACPNWSSSATVYSGLFLREPFGCAIVALTLNTGAYVSEIFRGGVLGVDRGLKEAGAALGLSVTHRFVYITTPIAIRLCLPAYSNDVISLMKSTALASTITLLDMMGIARTIVAETYAPYEIFLSVMVIYLIITWMIQRSFGWIEKRMSRHVRSEA